MAERAISQKKAQNQFLNTFAPVTVTLDELVRDKLKTGQFLSTKTGWIKAMAIVSYIKNNNTKFYFYF